MRTRIILSLLLLPSIVFAQQFPVVPVDNFNLTSGQSTVNAPFFLAAPGLTQGPVSVSQNAEVKFYAGSQVVLEPGFEAGGFTGNGFFEAAIGGQPDFDVAFITPGQNYPEVGKFEKLEIGVKLPPVVMMHVNNFLTGTFDPQAINPYDPERIDIEATFTNGVTVLRQYGFFYQDFRRDTSDRFGPCVWVPEPTDYNWRIRFAPNVTGQWHVSISVKLYNLPTPAYTVSGILFSCVPSSNPGFLEIGHDNRHLRFSGTGSSFFALGQNIGFPDRTAWRGEWINDPRWVPGYTIFESGFGDIYDFIENLADNGGELRACAGEPAGLGDRVGRRAGCIQDGACVGAGQVV